MKIDLGILADSLEDQLADYNINSDDMNKWKNIRFSISMLHIHGYINYAQSIKYKLKLAKEIEEVIKECDE